LAIKVSVTTVDKDHKNAAVGASTAKKGAKIHRWHLWSSTRGAQYQYFVIDSISIILFPFLSIPISISIILKRA